MGWCLDLYPLAHLSGCKKPLSGYGTKPDVLMAQNSDVTQWEWLIEFKKTVPYNNLRLGFNMHGCVTSSAAECITTRYCHPVHEHLNGSTQNGTHVNALREDFVVQVVPKRPATGIHIAGIDHPIRPISVPQGVQHGRIILVLRVCDHFGTGHTTARSSRGHR